LEGISFCCYETGQNKRHEKCIFYAFFRSKKGTNEEYYFQTSQGLGFIRRFDKIKGKFVMCIFRRRLAGGKRLSLNLWVNQETNQVYFPGCKIYLVLSRKIGDIF